jgi:hypothetical protein
MSNRDVPECLFGNSPTYAVKYSWETDVELSIGYIMFASRCHLVAEKMFGFSPLCENQKDTGRKIAINLDVRGFFRQTSLENSEN